MKISNGGFVNIQYWMVSDLKLRDKELIVYAIVFGFSQDGNGEFMSGYSYVMNFFGWSRPTATKAFEGLIEKKLIFKRVEDVNGVKFNRYSVNLQAVKNLSGVCKETPFLGGKETLHKNKVNKNKEATKAKTEIDVVEELEKFAPNFKHRDEIVNNKDHHGMWVEQTYMKFRLRPKQLGPLLNQFTQELILKDKTHHNITEFKRHFLNWLLTQERVDKLTPHQR